MPKESTMQSYSALLYLILSLSILVISFGDDEQEKLVLSDIKAHWSSSPQLATSWDASTPHCSWRGIQCINGSVSQISLSNLSLSNTLPQFICNLSNLSHLDLSINNITGNFPTSLYNCSSLRHLDLAQNLLDGALPDDIYKMSSQLAYIDLSFNSFSGHIPPSVGQLQSLRSLFLHENHFNGSFAIELANLVNLENLTLSFNNFSNQRIPSEFGNLTKLKDLWIRGANLVGEIPEALGKLTELEQLDLAENSLNGSIPAALWSLKKLKSLYLFSNNLTGEIEVTTLGSSIEEIDLSMNKLKGPIPVEFGNLAELKILFMYYNQLSGEIPRSIGTLTKLSDIRLFDNQLTGVLPPELGKHSELWNIEVWKNRFSGSLPDGLCANGVFSSVVAHDNNLTGELPSSLVHCPTLNNIMLHHNNLSGEFPFGIWSAAVALQYVQIHHNHFTGSLPDKLWPNLTRLEINDNKFSGKIPSYAPGLRVFQASNNMFSGEIPSSFSGMSNLQILALAGNLISGPIPEGISTLKLLTLLNLSNNQINGSIPAAMGSLTVLNMLDLSHNQLSGSVPPEIGNLKFNHLNLSYNQLSGEVPLQLQSPAYEQSFLSNPGLCSSKFIVNLNICAHQSHGDSNNSRRLVAAVLVALAGTVLLIMVVMGAMKCLRRPKGPHLPSRESIYFQRVDFNEDSIVHRLTNENLIGSGGSGKVYRISLGGRANQTVAVKKIWNNKKLNERVQKTFEAEAKILGSIRHANIVKLLCCISSDTSKLLVYEYMENRSLDEWLHGFGSGRVESLDWQKRIHIAIDVAQGLSYMHHNCKPQVVHRDVKSSNILLDSEFRAKIADFGLARIWVEAGVPESASNVVGTVGYMAPEYHRYPLKINEKVDVYSFGVVLLELTTGKRAQEGGEYEGLAGWAARCLREGNKPIDNMIDPGLTSTDKIERVLQLGVECTNTNPLLRPSMKQVLQKLMDCDELNEGRRYSDVISLLQMKRLSQHQSSPDDGGEDNS
ncbi:receptor-like protein kinase HSL1 [Canna indica]|uniref:Receptor-like protein kinase HSL1 n=1 Tax=Canna indica TaxID=4628 RepID=A0AAQ3JVH3_9LILI|nr:receptor-like protein kinase HSL1 [Canna indica]